MGQTRFVSVAVTRCTLDNTDRLHGGGGRNNDREIGGGGMVAGREELGKKEERGERRE